MQANWEEIAKELGTLREYSEIGGSSLGVEALEVILGAEFFEQAVEYYISCKPGFELARSVLLCVKPWTAMKHCYEIYKNTNDIEVKRSAVELLRVVSDRRVLEWIPEFLSDPDEGVQNSGIGVVDQLLFWQILHDEDVRPILESAMNYSSEYVRKQARWLLSAEDEQDS